jgi:hypothetical protein
MSLVRLTPNDTITRLASVSTRQVRTALMSAVEIESIKPDTLLVSGGQRWAWTEANVSGLSVQWTLQKVGGGSVPPPVEVFAVQSFSPSEPNYNAIAMQICYDHGLSALPDRMTMAEAAAVTNATMPSFANQRTLEEFDEFQYFTGVTTTPNKMFDSNFALKSVTLPPSLTVLGQHSFSNCYALRSIDISNIITIGMVCFSNCSRLEEITVSPNLTTIPLSCFNKCISLKKINNFNAKSILGNAFRDCRVLDNINLVDIIPITTQATFNNCYELSGTMKFAEGFNGRFSNGNCLQNCRSITHLDMPSTWGWGFEGTSATGMDSLIDITLRRVTPPTYFTHNFAQFPNTTLFYVPAAGLSAYQSAYPDYASRFRVIE